MRLLKLNVRDAGNTPAQGSSGRNSLKTQVQEGGKRGGGGGGVVIKTLRA